MTHPLPLTPRWLLSFAIFAVVTLAGCNPLNKATADPIAGLQPAGAPGRLTAVLPSTDVAVGKNQRFLFAVIGADNRPVVDASVDLKFFKVTGPNAAQVRGQASTEYRESPELPGRGLYVARADFDEPGDWGVAAQVSRPGEEPEELRVAFKVKDKSSTPGIGDAVPASRTLTAQTEDEAERFSSARPADPGLYSVSIDDALTQGKPLAVLFASPGFCTSRTCGPSLDVLQELSHQYAGRANFVHVEIYKDGAPPDPVKTVFDWGLTSEPWLFIVGADGRLVDKFEGSITVEETAPSLDAAIGR